MWAAPGHTGGFSPPPGGPAYPAYGQPAQPAGTARPARPAPVAAPPGTDFPGKTLGIVGLILAIVVNLAGIIVSAVALSRSRRAGFRNTPALAGVITGSVLMVIGIIVALTLAVIGVVGGLTSTLSAPLSPRDGSSVPWATATPDPVTTPNPGPTTESAGESLYYTVGECFDDQADPDIPTVLTDCAGPHDWEVYFDFTVPDTVDGAYPGDDKMQQAADLGCYDAFSDFVGVPYQSSRYDYGFVAPEKGRWTAYDDRTVSCAIYDPAGPTTGSLRGVER